MYQRWEMTAVSESTQYVPNNVYVGDARSIAENIAKDSVSLSVWSPPYHVGKEYERDISAMTICHGLWPRMFPAASAVRSQRARDRDLGAASNLESEGDRSYTWL